MENWTEVKIYPWEIFVRWSQERNEKWEEVWAHRTLVIGLCPVSRRQHEDAGIKKVQEVDHKYINEREARERLNSAVIHWSPSTSSTRLIVSRKKNNETREYLKTLNVAIIEQETRSVNTETLRPCEWRLAVVCGEGMKAYHSLGLVSVSHRDFLGILQTWAGGC